jgi:5,10-methylene-tetrahydrofolate dehydrogenase/methenyl tetrahydrofolate cyclohydrolase
MPKKGKAKNTLNKAKHTKLMNRKINKVKLEKQLHKERLKAIIKKVNEDKEPEESGNEEKENEC